MRVNVYRNVKKKPSILSVRCAASGLVLGHSHHAELTDCRFVIQSSGQSQVRKTHQKNVHAWVSGNLEYITDFSSIKERRLNNDVLHITEEEVQLVRDVSEDSPSVFKRVRIITDRWGNTDYRDIALLLKRTPNALLLKAQDLGLTSTRQRTRSIDNKDIKRLLIKGLTALEISVELGCTKRRINQIITDDIPEYKPLRDAIGQLRRKRGHL